MTFSIVAKDLRTGAFGVATATGGPVVGSLVPHARAGVGAIATQGYTTNPLYGFEGLDLLASGKTAKATVEQLVASDAGRERRQCIAVGRDGEVHAWTGAEILAYNGSIARQGFGVCGNLLTSAQVLEAMVETYESKVGQALEDRLTAALAAGQNAGGDQRGTTSAALKVYGSEIYPLVDIRSDWSERPVDHLAQILEATRGEKYAAFFKRLPTRANPGSG